MCQRVLDSIETDKLSLRDKRAISSCSNTRAPGHLRAKIFICLKYFKCLDHLQCTRYMYMYIVHILYIVQYKYALMYMYSCCNSAQYKYLYLAKQARLTLKAHVPANSP